MYVEVCMYVCTVIYTYICMLYVYSCIQIHTSLLIETNILMTPLHEIFCIIPVLFFQINTDKNPFTICQFNSPSFSRLQMKFEKIGLPLTISSAISVQENFISNCPL